MSKLKTKLRDILKKPGTNEAVTIQAPPLQKWDNQQVKQAPAETCRVAGKLIQLHRMRQSCHEAGHCLALTQELDCNLFPIRPGWCRGRVSHR